jgi:hypothetical protein
MHLDMNLPQIQRSQDSHHLLYKPLGRIGFGPPRLDLHPDDGWPTLLCVVLLHLARFARGTSDTDENDTGQRYAQSVRDRDDGGGDGRLPYFADRMSAGRGAKVDRDREAVLEHADVGLGGGDALGAGMEAEVPVG